jgi:hypothetical protein
MMFFPLIIWLYSNASTAFQVFVYGHEEAKAQRINPNP